MPLLPGSRRGTWLLAGAVTKKSLHALLFSLQREKMIAMSASSIARMLAVIVSIGPLGLESTAQSPPSKRPLSTQEALIRRQAESGLTLLTIDEGELRFVDFRTLTLRTLRKLDESIRPHAEPNSYADFWIDHDGKMLIGNRQLEGVGWAIFIANLEDGSTKRIKDNYARRPSLSPNGRFLAYQARRSEKSKYLELWRLNLEANTNDVLSTTLSWTANPAQWSADNNYLLFDRYIENDGQIRNAVAIFDTKSKSERVLLEGARGASWKPDSTDFAYIESHSIFRASLDAKTSKKEIWSSRWTPPLSDCAVTHSRDGEFIAFVRGSASDAINIKGFSEIELVVLGEGKPVRVYGPYERNKKLQFSWAEVPAVKKEVAQR